MTARLVGMREGKEDGQQPGHGCRFNKFFEIDPLSISSIKTGRSPSFLVRLYTSPHRIHILSTNTGANGRPATSHVLCPSVQLKFSIHNSSLCDYFRVQPSHTASLITMKKLPLIEITTITTTTIRARANPASFTHIRVESFSELSLSNDDSAIECLKLIQNTLEDVFTTM